MIRRTPLARSTTPVKKRRSKPRRVSVVRDQAYMDWLKGQACVACCAGLHPISAHVSRNAVTMTGARAFPVDPAHTINNGRGSKGPDDSCIPLCRYHHDEMDGRLSTKITTKQAFAKKYGLDLASQADLHYRAFKGEL